MKNAFSFNQNTNPSDLIPLKQAWLKTLTAPQDGMWESFLGFAVQWDIKSGETTIGYACVNEENQLLQFYLTPEWMAAAQPLFQQFIQTNGIKSGIICTNNPFCMAVAMHFQKSVRVHSYLFTDFLDTPLSEKEGQLEAVAGSGLARAVEFYHASMGASKGWLTGYLNTRIQRGELFLFENNDAIIGACEVRKSDSDATVADLGMVISPEYRRKGYGTFLLGKAKAKANEWGRKAICSCEKENIGSLKSIQKNGFRSIHQMLLMEFGQP